MKKALISPMESPTQYISGWTTDIPHEAILTSIENSYRVVQVVNTGDEFEVANPLFWVDCADDVMADKFYYNTTDNQIYLKPEPPPYP